MNIPLRLTFGSTEFMHAFYLRVLPLIRNFGPDVIFLSAGFDAMKGDFKIERNNQGLVESDYFNMTVKIRELAATVCEGRIVSVLEGGYGKPTLRECCQAHIRGLMFPVAFHVSKS